MLGKGFMAGVLAAAGAAALALPARGGDTQRLSLPKGAAAVPTVQLVDNGQSADVTDVRGGGGRGGFGGGRGFVAGGRGFVAGGRGFVAGGRGFVAGGRGFVAGGRGFVAGGRGFYGRGFYGNRGFYGRGFYGYGRGFYGYGRGFYGYGGYGGYYGYPGYYGGYYGYPSYYYGYPGYYGGSCYSTSDYYSDPVAYGDPSLYPSGGVNVAAPYVSLSITRGSTLPPPAYGPAPGQPLPVMPPPDATTFPYDGGPRTPPPMPNADPPAVPLPTPMDDKLPATPMKMAGKIVYPAYGERTLTAPTLADQTVIVKATTEKGK